MEKDPQIEEEQPQEHNKSNNKDLVFKEYSSLELSTRDKVIDEIRKAEFNKPNIEWVASEKIHGSNFSIHCSATEIRYGRRTDFLTESIPLECESVDKYFKESFYDARNLVQTFHNKIQNIYKTLKELYPDMIKFSLFGEYFGGNYPGVVNKAQKAVQKGVSYTPNHEFFVFDIFVYRENSAFWVDVSDIPKCLQDNLRSVPIYARGNFEEMFNIESVIDSTIPELLGLAKVEKNIIEGFVIRPNQNLRFKNGDRVILKKKNKEFLEVASAPKEKKEKVEKGIDPVLLPYLETLEAYLNFNRIESTTSKYPDLKDRNKLKTFIVQDILTDAAKDEFKEPEEEIFKKVKVELDKKVIKLLNEYFIKH